MKGEKGDRGYDYVLTIDDIREIADIVLNDLPRAEEAYF